VATTLLALLIAWMVTVPIVLGLARLLDRLTRPKLHARAETVEPRSGDPSAAADHNVVPLVPRGRNDLVQAGELRRAS
jgi:hypothetical protein